MNLLDAIDKPSNSLSLARDGLEKKIVDRAVDNLIQLLAKEYLSLRQDTLAILESNPYYYKEDDTSFVPYRQLANDNRMIIPHYLLKTLHCGEARYHAILAYKITNLNKADPLEGFLQSLSDKIAALGYSCDDVEVRLEKGCFNPILPEWHKDSFDTSVAVCYSHKKGWSTRILDEKRHKEKLGNIQDFKGFICDETLLTTIEAVSEAARWGFFYDVTQLFHRSPIKEDLLNQELSVDDYRLSILFTR